MLKRALLCASVLAAVSSPVFAAEKLNLNQATVKQLEALPGLGAKRAEAIVAFRQKQAFKSVDELAKVKGIGKKRLEKLTPDLSV